MKYLQPLIWTLLTGLMIFLAFNQHSRKKLYTYQCEIWADKAGYYSYLPAVFIYSLDGNKYPAGIEEKIGRGFSISDGKIICKYNYGIALLQLPFFAVAHALTLASSGVADGFTIFYQKLINLAAVFYLIAGLILLYNVLSIQYTKTVSAITIAAILAGTNLYYYSVNETGMSHVYSFFLFAVILYLVTCIKSFTARWYFLTAFMVVLILVIRPTNLFFLLAVLVLYRMKILQLITQAGIKEWILTITGALLAALPQMLYWKYTSGKFITYSYTNEGFSNWNKPELAKTLFAPENSLLLYTPLFIIILAGIVYLLIKKEVLGWVLLLTFAALVYMTASWWTYSFGCGFGVRNFVEYYTLFSFPLAILFTRFASIKMRVCLFILVALCIVWNLKLSYAFDECWFGIDSWDWLFFRELLTK